MTRALHGPSGGPPRGGPPSHQRPADLKAWNDAHDYTIFQEDEEILDDEVLEDRAGSLRSGAERAGDRGLGGVSMTWAAGLHRVHPQGSWPAETWEQDLLGYAPPDPPDLG